MTSMIQNATSLDLEIAMTVIPTTFSANGLIRGPIWSDDLSTKELNQHLSGNPAFEEF